MNYRVMQLCSWSGVIFVVLIGVGFGWFAGFIPPPAPSDTLEQTAARFLVAPNGIRFGMIVSMVAASFLMPYTVAIALHMRRIEGSFPALTMIQFGSGALVVLEFIYLLFFWMAATFRAERAPELVQLVNDMAWIPFIGISSTLITQAVTFGIVILLDRRATPIFPRWLGFFNLWAGLMFVPGTFNVFFLTGPLAWDGWLAFYAPIVVFLFWMIFNSIYLSKATARQREEIDAAGNAAAEGSLPSHAALAADLDRLRAELRLLAGKN